MNQQVKETISFGGHEKNVIKMRDHLMEIHGMNKSQLTKHLIRKEYDRLGLKTII